MERKKNHTEMIAAADVKDYLNAHTPLTWKNCGGDHWSSRSRRTKTSYWIHGRPNELFRVTAGGDDLVSGTLDGMASAVSLREAKLGGNLFKRKATKRGAHAH